MKGATKSDESEVLKRVEKLQRNVEEMKSTVKTLSALVSQMYFEDEDDDFEDGERQPPKMPQPTQPEIFGHQLN
jgi:hypothetical protein